MSDQQAAADVIAELDALPEHGDNESAHCAADDALCDFLRKIGHGEVAAAFERASSRVGFWYA